MAIFNPAQKSRFKETRQAYQPIRQGNATQQQGQAFSSLRDQNSGLINKKVGQLSGRQDRLTNRMDRMTSNGAPQGRIDRVQGRLDKVGNRLGNFQSMQAYQPPTPEPAAQDNSWVRDRMFPDITQREPIDPTESELYKLQADKGTERLNRELASRGLYNSGAAIEGHSEFLRELGANEAQRQQDVFDRSQDRNLQAGRDAMNYGLGAGGLALQDRQGQTNSMISLLNTMLSSNAFQTGAGAAGDQANLASRLGESLSGLAGQAYGRPGPTGGGGYGPFIPPFPGSPDQSGADSFDAIGGGSSSANWSSSVADIIGKILGGR